MAVEDCAALIGAVVGGGGIAIPVMRLVSYDLPFITMAGLPSFSVMESTKPVTSPVASLTVTFRPKNAGAADIF